MSQSVNLELDGRVAIVTLNRPEVLNAINTQLASDLCDVCDELQARDDIWVAIMRGAGERAFSAGADLKERQNMSAERWIQHRRVILRAFRTLSALEKPIIAAVDGFALGGGCELAMLCDFIIASERAQFALPEARVGIIPGGGGTQLLPRLVGRAMAKELIFTGRRIDAAEALRIGLVNRVVAIDDLWPTVRQVADEILGSSPISIRQAKRAIDRGGSIEFHAGWALEEEAYTACLYSQDRIEGINAFAEKRPPKFQNL